VVGAQTVKILTVSHESAQDTQDDNVPNRQTYQTYIDITQQAQTRVYERHPERVRVVRLQDSECPAIAPTVTSESSTVV
jgi:hypothetical protein